MGLNTEITAEVGQQPRRVWKEADETNRDRHLHPVVLPQQKQPCRRALAPHIRVGSCHFSACTLRSVSLGWESHGVPAGLCGLGPGCGAAAGQAASRFVSTVWDVERPSAVLLLSTRHHPPPPLPRQQGRQIGADLRDGSCGAEVGPGRKGGGSPTSPLPVKTEPEGCSKHPNWIAPNSAPAAE